jgi:glycosyltransferase involved in cell wall biosynthesis
MTQAQQNVATLPEIRLQKPRVGLVCDFVEENWPSMDLVANMVFERLDQEHSSTLEVTRICPPLRPRFGRIPGIGQAAMFRNADRLLNRFVDYGRALKPRTEEFDLYHLIDHSYSQLVLDLPPGKTVVTCHDLDTFRCVLQPEHQPRPRWFRAMTERILDGFRKAAHVIAVSATTGDEIVRLGLHPSERVTVISNGVHPSCSPLANPVADSQLSRLLPIDSQDGIWLLNVGSSMPRKRLDLLLRVFAEVRKQMANVRLLRIGERLTGEQRQLARDLGVEFSIVELSGLDREVLAAAYRRATMLLHTAEAEGFGLPVIEAMACGCPVIASDLPVLREVGGMAASYCAVGDLEGWKNTILAAIPGSAKHPENSRLERERGFSNAARFSWSENAARTAGIYLEIVRQQLMRGQLLGKGI